MKYTTGFEVSCPTSSVRARSRVEWSKQRYLSYLRETPCPSARQAAQAGSTRGHLNDFSISDVCELSLVNTHAFMAALTLTDREAHIAAAVLREVRLRLES